MAAPRERKENLHKWAILFCDDPDYGLWGIYPPHYPTPLYFARTGVEAFIMLKSITSAARTKKKYGKTIHLTDGTNQTVCCKVALADLKLTDTLSYSKFRVTCEEYMEGSLTSPLPEDSITG